MTHTISKCQIREALDLADLDQQALRQGYQGGGTFGSTGHICLVLDGHRNFAQFLVTLGMCVDQGGGDEVDQVMRLAGSFLIDYTPDANIYYWTQLTLTD